MTSRPVLGSSSSSSQRSSQAAPRQSLNSSNVVQRPPPHRSLSHHFPPSPSTSNRRTSEALVDLALDGQDAVALGRSGYGTIPRKGGSRLKLEISKDSRDADVIDSPKVTMSATPTWRPGLPPRGRPQLHSDVPTVTVSVSNPNPRAALEGGRNTTPIKPMPLPVRPGQHVPPPVSDKARTVRASPTKKDVRPKPYVLEVPAAAPHYSPNGHADFFPWTGNHPEDHFSDSIIRQGQFDKAQISQNETGSGRPSIFPTLKHKSGLQALSSLFTRVLTQRRAHGQITSNSTFKPPPRVTVTDTKREMWLKDLANPTIPLRRLSRSIPHGIRGKVLLDQSLSKNIPIERAVWLAKCVGANELRSFRRKGVSGTFAMGGEAKWVRDFTVCVEQFVESVLGTCGEKDFKVRINYAIRLATYFYAEYLLDREHYMDWLVSSLENSPQAKLPLWLIVTQIYWKDLLGYRKYGRRLSAALLGHLAETLNQTDQDILAPLIDRLKSSLKRLMTTNPESFILSQSWMKHRDLLLQSLVSDDDRFRAVLSSIDGRNCRVLALKKQDAAPRRRLIELLDATLSHPFKPELPKQGWEIDIDKSVLIRALLEWSTSSYRPGHAKIFVAARILRSWSRYGADVSREVLGFLDSEVCESSRSRPAFYHLISELVRSEHFSVPLYLQWLMARGGIYDSRELSTDGPCASRLLAELPSQNFSEGLISLRRTLLDRAGYSVDGEEERTMSFMLSVNASLPNMEANMDQEMELAHECEIKGPEVLVADLGRAEKSEIGLWLRQKVGLQMIQPTIPPLDDWDHSPMKGGTSAITAFEFNLVRTYLEALDDYSMLADVLKMVSSSNDAEVLASCADTLNLNLDVFAAIGALNGLFEILMARLRALAEEADLLPSVFLASLADLAARVPEQQIVAKQLAQEVFRNDRKNAADACSPVSDHMMGIIQSSESNFAEDIEKIMATGNSMEQATLERLFQRIVSQLEKSWGKSSDQHRNCVVLLSRLRTFNTQRFDVLVSAWVIKVLKMQDRPSIVHTLAPLVSSGCLSLRDIFAALTSILNEEINPTALMPAKLSREALALAFTARDLPEIMTPEEVYRLRIKQRHMQKDYPLDIFNFMRRAGASDTGEHYMNIHHKQATLPFLQRLAVISLESISNLFVRPLLQAPTAGSKEAVAILVDELLAADRLLDGSEISVADVLSKADDLTIPFCQLKLITLFQCQQGIVQGMDEGKADLLDALDAAIESAVDAGKTAWFCLIPLLEVSVAEHLRQRAEIQFLSLFPFHSPASKDALANRNHLTSRAETLLNIVAATAHSISSNSGFGSHTASSVAPEIVKIFNSIWMQLSTSQSPVIRDAILKDWFPLVLTFTTIQSSTIFSTLLTPTPTTTKPGTPGPDHCAKLLLAFSAILLELQASSSAVLSTPNIPTLIEQTFDLALLVVDGLPDDTRLSCIQNLRDAVSDRKLAYLWSVQARESEWLMLSQKERVGEKEKENEGGGKENAGKRVTPFPLRRWEMLGEPTPNVGENDTSLSLTLFGARRG